MNIILLLLACVAVLFVLDVVLGRPVGGRLPLREFVGRAVPLFLLIMGLGLLPAHPFVGLCALAAAVLLHLFSGRNGRCPGNPGHCA